MELLLDTRDAEPRDRYARWIDGTSRLFFPFTGEPHSGRPFCARVRGGRLGPVSTYRVQGDGNTCWRTQREIAANDPEQLTLHVVRRGQSRFAQEDRRAVLGPADMALIDSSRPMRMDVGAGFDMTLFVFPKHLLGAAADRMSARTATVLPGLDGVPGSIRAFLDDLADGIAQGAGTYAAPELADSLVALLRTLYGAPAPDTGDVRRPIATSLLRRIQRDIDGRLRDPGLTLDQIAAAHFITTRYLHKLFEIEGTSASTWIRHRRLEGARRDLLDPALATWTIGQIAASWGLASPKHFSRAFGAAYGCTPRDLRQRAAEDASDAAAGRTSSTYLRAGRPARRSQTSTSGPAARTASPRTGSPSPMRAPRHTRA